MPLKRKSTTSGPQDPAASRNFSPASSVCKRGRRSHHSNSNQRGVNDEQVLPWLCLLHRRLTGFALNRRALEAANTLQRDGFVVFRQFLSSQSLRSLRRHVDDVYRNKSPGVDGEWILNLHQQLPRESNWMWALATAPFIVKLLQSQLGPNVVLYCSQLHCKRRFQTQSDEGDQPGFNSAVPWHQDGGANVRTLWIALDPVSPHTGGLKMLRRGHKLGRLPYAPVTSVEELAQASYFAENNVFRVDDAAFSKADVVPYSFPAGAFEQHVWCMQVSVYSLRSM
eukprot:INCI12537.1.p1 GENE.INCI12537.1~~INCI12537.1.p1  ORF type:complete len:282 (+),score=37.47 INCI12537.1:34-879(+)